MGQLKPPSANGALLPLNQHDVTLYCSSCYSESPPIVGLREGEDAVAREVSDLLEPDRNRTGFGGGVGYLRITAV